MGEGLQPRAAKLKVSKTYCEGARHAVPFLAMALEELVTNQASYYKTLSELMTLQRLVKRKVFISYYHGDHGAAQAFVDRFGGRLGAFIPRALGLSYEDDLIDSKKAPYVINTISEQYIQDSSVNLVLIGSCTHSRRFIDWEIKRGIAKRNGLVGIMLPPNSSVHLPERFAMNYKPDNSGYARFYYYPEGHLQLYQWIEAAYEYRRTRDILAKNPQEPWGNNRVCRVCVETH